MSHAAPARVSALPAPSRREMFTASIPTYASTVALVQTLAPWELSLRASNIAQSDCFWGPCTEALFYYSRAMLNPMLMVGNITMGSIDDDTLGTAVKGRPASRNRSKEGLR